MAGFDDTVAAFGHGLTSYNFNMPAVVAAMIGFILSPQRPPAGCDDAGIIDAPGMIMVRSSTSAG